MCLAIPTQVVELLAGDMAIVDVGGVRKEISLALVDGVEVGDYVILHVGYALNKLDREEAEKTLRLFAQVGERLAGPHVDPLPPFSKGGRGLDRSPLPRAGEGPRVRGSGG